MKAIDIKLFRDLLHMKGQAVAIGAVIGCGIAIFIGSQSTLWSLQNGLDAYYERYRFANLFTGLKRAPIAVADRVAEIPGVAAVSPRIVQGVTLDIEELDEPAVGRLISLPNRGEPKLNNVYLLKGRLPEPTRTGEVLAEEAFVSAHGFEPGDTIDAVMNGRLQTLTIVGVGMSPEYLTTIQPGSLFPDDKRFGIFWMRRRQIEAAFDMEGAFNDLTLSLLPGTNSEEVIRRVDQILDRYGSLGANDRDRNLSHRFVSDEFQPLKIMGIVPPSIFLGVAAFLLNVAMRRLLSLQREQIAALKAFGYSSFGIGIHYAKLVGLIILGGAVFGCFVGSWMGDNLTSMYAKFYRFPNAVFQPDLRVFAGGILLSFVAGFVGVTVAVCQAVKIPPAEAMRPEAPPDYRQTFFERMGWDRWLSQAPRMILRELVRRPVKAGLTSLGIALACAVLVVGNFGKDAIDYLMDFQFGLEQRQDAVVNFYEAVPARAVTSLKQIPGVQRIESFRSVPVRLRFGQYSRQLGIMGLSPDRDLFRLLDAEEKVISIPESGLVISKHLAGILHLKVGDEVTIEVLEKQRPVREATVVGVVNDYAGSSAYMDLRALNDLMREPPVISGVFLDLDPAREEAAYQELKNTPLVAGVNLTRAAMQGFMESFAENMLQMRIFNVVFACVIAVGVVYNSARVALSERSRELATLRVIGFTRGEVSAMLLGELGFLTLVALPFGMLIGYGLCAMMVASLPTENYRIPLVLDASTFAFAAVVIVVAAVLSGLMVRRGIDHLDLVGVLKSRE